MKVPVDKIGEEGLDVSETVTRAWLDEALGENAGFQAASDGRLELRLLRTGESVHVFGKVDLSLSATCSRCLEPAVLPFASSIQVTLFPRGKEPPSAADGELAEEDAGTSTYDEMEIDLSHVIRDEVFLGLPMNPLCSDECAGLCARCGSNLNVGSCSCEPQVDHRWEALQRTKVGSKES